LLAQPAERELLNSERIEAKFGSYGIELVEKTESRRVSNLYSVAGGQRICRTFAIVSYPRLIDPRVSKEHAAIVAGGSIGAVFVAAGWEVRKTHLSYREVPASPGLASLMHIEVGAPLAMDIYVLAVTKGRETIEYATLVEIHHPDYLTSADLPAIYGPVDDSRPDLVLEAFNEAFVAVAFKPKSRPIP
jgi:hypothetical protein